MSDVENASEQLFATNTDLFDAEIDSDNEAVETEKDGGQIEEEGFVIENGGNRSDKSDEEIPFDDSDDEGEESLEKIKQKAKKFRTTLEVTASSTKEPKGRKAKKDAVTKLHSESQRLVRESRVRLPYHQPETKDIRHFLKRVPVNSIKNDKHSRTDHASKQTEEAKTAEKKEESSETDDLTTTEPDAVGKPKLSGATDPFFFDDISSKKSAGLNHLMERFISHNKSKLKQTKADEDSKVKEQTQNFDVVEVTHEVEKLKTTENTESEKNQKIPQPIFQPGDNLRRVKEKLQAKMKLQRAEVRKIHESRRKIDEEEVSDEEEEEFDGEDEDSDFEVDEWNAEDERVQEEQTAEDEENETNELQVEFSEESNSVADSDTNHRELKTRPKIKQPNKLPTFPDEQTIDLFPSDNSNQTANRTWDEGPSDNESMGSEESIKLRLDSVEDTQDNYTDDQSSEFTKLKVPDIVHEPSSDTSNWPNAQVQKSGMTAASRESLDRSSSNDGLTPFSKIQRLLGVDCSSVPREKSKPISELTLPVEDSQDLYDEDDVDKRFSDGFNTSKDFNFALDEDTQFTQFVDTQGYLLSTSKKKRTKDMANDRKSNNMSELLGLCSGTFSDEPKKKPENGHDMDELLGLCSGNFSDASNAKTTKESQDNMNELLGLCSGKFTDEMKTNSDSQNMSELLGLCSGRFSNENTVSKSNGLSGLSFGKLDKKTNCKSTSESQSMDELLGLCSGKFDDTEKADSRTQSSSDLFDSKTNVSLQSESSKKDQWLTNELLRENSGRFNSVGNTNDAGIGTSGEPESGIFSQLGVERKPKSKQGLSAMFEKMGDEENSMDDVVALCSGKFPGTQKSKENELENSKTADNEDSDIELENSDTEKDDVEANSENSENEVFSDDERQADDEMMEKDKIKMSKKYGITYGKKEHSIFNKDNFVEEEAELSGSDASSDEEEGSEDDELEEDSDCEDLPSDDELQRQVNKVHLKSVIDEDKRELRELKERYLEDGDLYSEGGGRARNFKWQGLEDSQLDSKVLWGDEEIVDSALLSEAELERRKMKHEKDQFLQEQLSREGDTQPTDVDENSQNILNLIKDTSNAAIDGVTEKTEKPAPKRQDSTSTKLSQKRGSFLNRSKDQMSRLSSITAIKTTINSTRGFVFHTVSPSSKTKENSGQKLQRSVSLSEPPNPKRPRLDRSTSITTGSLFAAMPV